MGKKLRVGVIGYGFMGRAHSNAYYKVNKFFDLEYEPVLQAICGRNEEKTRAFAQRWGYASYETDWRKLIERDDIDAIDICTPNDTHHDIAIAAAERGKIVLCEKPLARTGAEAREMVQAVEKAGVPNFVWFNYRRVPAITLAHQVISEGKLGRVFHYRAVYLQDWTIDPNVPQGGHTFWRLDINAAGSGVLGDLLSHSIDTAMWLNGPIVQVNALMETFVKERVHQEKGAKEPVKIDDATLFLARFQNGSIGTFESTRYARGRKNKNAFEINGEHASIYFDLEDPHRLEYFEHSDDPRLRGWRSIHVTGFEHPYHKNWWVPGTTIGYEHTFINALADFLKGLETGEPTEPTFRTALKTQLVCDAVTESARTGTWANVPQE